MSSLEAQDDTTTRQRCSTPGVDTDGYGRPIERSRAAQVIRSSWVYFLIAERTECVNIGHTCDLRRRLKELQAACPFKLDVLKAVGGGPAFEAKVHAQFADLRLHSEWFSYTEELAEFIRDLPAEPW
jgi:hypothetical protein